MDGKATEIDERLALLEKSMRRYRAALAAVTSIAAVGLAGPSLVGASKAPQVIQAKRFEVVDDNGTVRASLNTDNDGEGLALYDKAGRLRAGLGEIADNVSLALADRAGKTRVELVSFEDQADLRLNDRTENERVFLATRGDNASLILHDEAGKMRAALGNFDLEITATGSTEHRAASSLVLLNEQGRVLWEAP